MFVKYQPESKHKNPFTPDFIASSVTDIDFDWLDKQGVKACLIDLDGTVVARSDFHVADAIKHKLRDAPTKLFIATNRPKSRDLKDLRKDLRADGVVHPKGIFGKPSKRYFSNACKDLGLKPLEVVMIGDRFLQDIYGANRAGIRTILISGKIGSPRGWFDTRLSKAEKNMAKKLAEKYETV